MARRRSSVTNRLTKIRGITAIEKDLFKRIGETIDSAMNNRAPTNPGISPLRRTVRKRNLPPPKNLQVQVSTQNALVTWDPVNSPVLNFYEVQITNRDTNLAVLKLAFSSRLYIGDSGSFEVKVRSVGRNGDASPYSTESLSFEISDDVLFLEGNKHETTLTNELIAEDIFTPEAYKVFCWGAFNLNDLADPGTNRSPFLEFSQETLYPIFSRLKMFPENETYVNVDDNLALFASSTLRPNPKTDTQFWESPQSAMFKPYPVLSTDNFVDQAAPFNVFLDNRDDGVGLSMTLFSIPATITEVEEEEVEDTNSVDINRVISPFSENFLRWDILQGNDIIVGLYPTFTIHTWVKNFMQLFDDGGGYRIDFLNFQSDSVTQFPTDVFFQTRSSSIIIGDPGDVSISLVLSKAGGTPSLLAWDWGGVALENTIRSLVGKWTHLAITYVDSGDDPISDTDAILYINGVDQGAATQTRGSGKPAPFSASNKFFLSETRIELGASGIENKLRMYERALFNRDLSPLEVSTLTNNPTHDLRFGLGAYAGNENLMHYWRLGLDPFNLGIDSGFFAPTIDANREELSDDTHVVADAPSEAGEA